jgi:hypothetical protein
LGKIGQKVLGKFAAGLQIALPSILGAMLPPESLHATIAKRTVFSEAFAPLIRAFLRDWLMLVKTTTAKIPTIAITISSSINVNPLFFKIFFDYFLKI